MHTQGSTPFGDRLKQARRAKGFSAQGLALECGIDQASVSGWENRGRKPDFYSLLTLAQVLECSIDWLVGLKEN